MQKLERKKKQIHQFIDIHVYVKHSYEIIIIRLLCPREM
jgi:hypothetical protein